MLLRASLQAVFLVESARVANGTRGAPVRVMAKQKGRVPKLAKLTGANGTVVVDAESGILIGVSNDDERPSSRGEALTERRSQPPRSPNSKLSRN